MSFGAARLATEKAVFRPALLLSILPGITEMQMGTLTFKEQYKHPNWQRKRLEIMQRDGFKCQCCYSDEDTLNVHHKQYFKGRMIWDYPESLLVTLCEGCHEHQHDRLDDMKMVIGSLPVDGPGSVGDAVKVLAGWANEEHGGGYEAYATDYPFVYYLGEIAGLFSVWSAAGSDVLELRDLLKQTPMEDRYPVVIAALKKNLDV